VEEHVCARGGHPTGESNCLTLSGVSATPGTVTARGTAHRLFENHFRVVLRDSSGQVLAMGAVTVSGRWSVSVHYTYTAPQGQGASFAAEASSAKVGALACLVQKAFALAAANPRANLSLVYRAYADVNGDGRPGLVTRCHASPSKGQLTVMLARGDSLSVTTPSDAVWLPGLAAAGNVDGRPGEELFVDVTHVATAESISIRWMRQDTVYVWQGAKLKRSLRHAATLIKGQPSPTLVGVQCGHPL
jgi:hypothetical protein